jgi:hypothetical protein
MGDRPFDDAPEGVFGIVKARSHRANLTADDPGDVFVGHLLHETKQQHFSVFRGDLLQGRMDSFGVLSGEIFFPVVLGKIDLFERIVRLPALAKRATHLTSGDLIEPGGKRSRVSQSSHTPENSDPHVLKKIIRTLGVAEHFPQKVAQALLVGGNQLLEGCAVASLASKHQQAPVDPVRDLGHRVAAQ